MGPINILKCLTFYYINFLLCHFPGMYELAQSLKTPQSKIYNQSENWKETQMRSVTKAKVDCFHLKSS